MNKLIKDIRFVIFVVAGVIGMYVMFIIGLVTLLTLGLGIPSWIFIAWFAYYLGKKSASKADSK